MIAQNSKNSNIKERLKQKDYANGCSLTALGETFSLICLKTTVLGTVKYNGDYIKETSEILICM